jgi:Flp pilus assembly protein TadD
MLIAVGLWYLIQHRNSAISKIAKISLISLLLLHSAKTLHRNGDWRSDHELFVSAIAINPHNGKLYNNLGHDHEGKGDHVTAERLFRRAVKVQPDDIGAYINLGRALRALGQDQQAEKVNNIIMSYMCAWCPIISVF